jgi:hypothetical protein
MEVTLKRNSEGRFGVSFHAPGDGTICLDRISDAHDVDDDRKRLCVGDIVLSLNGIMLEEAQSEEALLRCFHSCTPRRCGVITLPTGPL